MAGHRSGERARAGSAPRAGPEVRVSLRQTASHRGRHAACIARPSMKKFLLVLGLSLVAAACSAGSESELLGGAAARRNHPVGEGTATDTSATEATTDASTDLDGDVPESTSATDGGADADAAGDAAAKDASAPPPTAFTGAAAYAATNGPSTLKGEHPNGGNPAKVDCLTSNCHGAGGSGPRFAAGGTVFTSAAGTTPAAQVEVRLRDAAGNAVSAYTDASGNFFVRAAAAAALTFPVQTGARNTATTRAMSATIANGACNSAACHGSAATGFIHVP